MPKFRYVAVSPLRIEDKPRLGPAIYLHEFLVDHQTDAEGRVNYGKPVTYAWILAKWASAPNRRTLERYMRRLRESGYVRIERAPWDQGMRICIIGSAKWPNAPAQIPLFPPPDPVSIASGKACGKPVSKSREGILVPPTKVSYHPRQKCRRKEVKNLREEKIYGNTARFARSSPVEDAEAIAERRRLLKDQARQLMAKANTAG